MKFYAERPARRARQVVADALVVVWTYIWIMLAIRLHDLISKLAAPGQKLQDAGKSMSDNLSGAGNRVADVPGVGGALASPLRKAATAATGIASAGQQEQAAIHDLALTLAVLVVIVPLAMVLLGWLPLRVRWIRRAGASAALREAAAGRDLLAVRALATQPLRRLTALDPDIAAAWRRGDEAAIESLAALELRRFGLR